METNLHQSITAAEENHASIQQAVYLFEKMKHEYVDDDQQEAFSHILHCLHHQLIIPTQYQEFFAEILRNEILNEIQGFTSFSNPHNVLNTIGDLHSYSHLYHMFCSQ